MASCSSISPPHVKMADINAGGEMIYDAYNDISEIIGVLTNSINDLGSSSLQYGTGSAYIIEELINETIKELNTINGSNSELPSIYKSIAESQNSEHDAAIVAENNTRESKAKNKKPPETPDLISCTRGE